MVSEWAVGPLLHCIPTLGGGGAERQLAYLACELARRGNRIHIAALRGGENVAKVAGSPVIIHYLKSRNSYDPRVLIQLIGLIRTIRPAFIQTWLPQMDILGAIAARITGIPWVMSERSSAMAYRYGWKSRVRKLVGPAASLVIANSVQGMKYWEGTISPDALAIVPNCLMHDEVANAVPLSRAQIGIDSSSELIVYAGRYSYEKNLFALVEAFEICLSSRQSANVVMCGEGPLESELRARVAKLKVSSRIQIWSFQRSLWPLLKASDVFVSVSEFEGLPNTVLEAAACGCPMVLSDIAAHREIAGDGGAELVPAKSPQMIAAGLCRVLSDRDNARRRARDMTRRVGKYSIDRIADDYVDALSKMLATASSQSTHR